MSETDEAVEGDGGKEQVRAGVGGTAGLRLFTRNGGRAQEPKHPGLSTGACDGGLDLSAISSPHCAGQSYFPHLSPTACRRAASR